jgi:acetolactate synthase regulatory subunit
MPASTAQRRRLELHTLDAPDLLVRVLLVLRRRGCVVVAVDYRASDRHRPGHFAVTVDAPARTGHSLDAWLENVVGVTAVHGSGQIALAAA